MSDRLQPQRTCPVCDEVPRRLIGVRGDRPVPALLAGEAPALTVEVFRCRSCGHYYCDPMPLPTTLADLYEHVRDYFGTEPVHGPSTGTLAAVEQACGLRGGRLLDIGCGTGLLLDAARAAGWEATGVEPTVRFADEARAKAHDVHVGYIDAAFERPPFDVAVLSGVLEHVPDPVGVLRDTARHLRPGGWIYFDVPNGRRLDAWLVDRALRLRRQPWTVRTAPLQPPFHLSEFSADSARRALERAGYRGSQIRLLPGSVPYPLPAGAAAVARAAYRIGAPFGGHLNLAACGQKDG